MQQEHRILIEKRSNHYGPKAANPARILIGLPEVREGKRECIRRGEEILKANNYQSSSARKPE